MRKRSRIENLEEKKQDVEIPGDIIDMIADYSHEIIIHLDIKDKFKIENKFLLEVLKQDRIDILNWAKENGWKWYSYNWCVTAARYGKLNILKWLQEEKCPWNSDIYVHAASCGHLHILEWAVNLDPDKSLLRKTTEICAFAARNGHFNIVKFARENGFPWDEKTCANAAKIGHFDILKFAQANGCPWDEKTCASAAKNGHFDILKFARDNGCPWDEKTCANAARNGHFDILEWAVNNRSPDSNINNNIYTLPGTDTNMSFIDITDTDTDTSL